MRQHLHPADFGPHSPKKGSFMGPHPKAQLKTLLGLVAMVVGLLGFMAGVAYTTKTHAPGQTGYVSTR